MRNHQLITTFKSGKMSPRLLGRRDVDAVKSACLELENGIVNLDGSVSHVGGFKYLSTVYSSTQRGEGLNFFSARLSGRRIGLSFNGTYGINYLSYINIPQDNGESDLTVSGIRYYGFASAGSYPDFGSGWNTQAKSAGGADLTGMADFFTSLFNVYPTQMAQITDNTCLFTGQGVVPFYVTYYDGYLFVYPIYVNFIQYITNKLETTTYIEMQPTTVPYGEENTLSASKVYIHNPGIYTGSHSNSSTRITSANTYLYYVFVKDSDATSVFSKFPRLTGRILRVTNTDATESAYLILGVTTDYSNGTYNRCYKAIRLIGGFFDNGTTSHETSLWRLSQWGYYSEGTTAGYTMPYPKVVCQHRGRPLLANTYLQQDTLWASSINDKDAFNIGIYSQTVLKQDVTTDGSGLKYYGASVLDRLAYELGLADGEVEEIQWISSRRRIHIGTSNGEYQLTSNAEFTYSKIESLKLGSIKSKRIQPCSGDRKIIYMDHANFLRAISTEDKNYESEDINLSVAYGQIDIGFNEHLSWDNMVSSVVTNKSDLKTAVALSLDESTKTVGASEIKLPIGIDIEDSYITQVKVYGTGSGKVALISNQDDTFQTIDAYIEVRDYPYVFAKNNSGAVLSYLDQFRFMSNFIGIEVTVILNDDTSLVVTPELGFDISLLGYNTLDCLELRVPIKFRLKSFPIEDNYPFGSSVGVISRWDKATVQYIDSGKFYVGSEDTNLLPVEGITDADLKTGQATIDFPNSPDRQNHIIIESTNPITISGVCMRGVVYGED